MPLSDDELRKKSLEELFTYFRKNHPDWNGERAVEEVMRIRGDDDLSGEFADMIANQINFWRIGALVEFAGIVIYAIGKGMGLW